MTARVWCFVRVCMPTVHGPQTNMPFNFRVCWHFMDAMQPG